MTAEIPQDHDEERMTQSKITQELNEIKAALESVEKWLRRFNNALPYYEHDVIAAVDQAEESVSEALAALEDI